jgi:uncharacterized membrane protein YkoI
MAYVETGQGGAGQPGSAIHLTDRGSYRRGESHRVVRATGRNLIVLEHDSEEPMRTSRKVVTGLAAVAAATAVALSAGSALGSGSGSGDDEDSPSFTSSVTAPADAGESEQDETEANEGTEDEAAEQAADDAEQRALLNLATVDAAAARAAALATARGSVTETETELENEDGNVVWKVEIRDRAGLETTVYVDAGNAKVLLEETDD